MADGGMVEVAKATITLVPNMSGSQAEITSQLTGITKDASEQAGEEGGSAFGSKFAGAIKAGTAVIGAAIAGATAAAVATGKAFVGAAQDVAAYGDQVDKQSQRLGLSAQSYQELDYVLRIAGSSMDNMSAGMKTLTNQLDAAMNGSESAQAMFGALGLSMDDLANMSREDVFKNVIYGFQGMEDSAERAALANDLLGRSGQQLAPLFNMTAEETAGLIDQANEYGMVLDDTAVKASADFTDSMTTLKKTIEGVKNSMMSQFLPGLTQVTSGLAAVFAGDESGIGQIESGLKDVINNITTLAPQFFSLAQTLITSLLSGFAPMLPQLVSTIFSVLVQAITTVTTMLPEIMPQIIAGLQGVISALFEALPVITNGIFELITAVVNWLSEGETVTELINGIVDLTSLVCAKFAELLPVLLPAIVKIIGEVVLTLTSPENIGKLVEAALLILVAIIEALINAVPELINFVIGVFDNLTDLVAAFFFFFFPKIAEGILAIYNKVQSWGENIRNFITNLVNNIKNGVSNFGENIKNYIFNLVNNIRNGITNFIENVKNGFSNGFNTIKNGVNNIINKVKDLVNNMINTIKELPERVVSIGSNLVSGLWYGISDKIEWVKNKIWGMGSAITNAIKGVFGIASPSKVWAKEIGQYLPLGLYAGYEDSMEDVKEDIASDMEGLTSGLTAEVQAYGTAGAAMYDSDETFNYGGNVVNVYATEGQDVKALADEIAVRLEDMTRRKGAVYA